MIYLTPIQIDFNLYNYIETIDIPTTFPHPEAQYILIIILTEESVPIQPSMLGLAGIPTSTLVPLQD